jgi:hypothetical protein
VDVIYRGSEGTRIASFADLDEVTGTASYNRMFARLEDVLQARREGSPAAVPPPAGPEAER